MKEKSKYLLGGIILGMCINKSINFLKNVKNSNKEKEEILLDNEIKIDQVTTYNEVKAFC